jgi:hypothetical protein
VEAASVSTGSKRPAVLADGTYATQVSVSETAAGGAAVPNLRAVLLTGDFFLGSVVATSLTKLVLRMCVTATPLRMRLTRREGERPLRSNHPRM